MIFVFRCQPAAQPDSGLVCVSPASQFALNLFSIQAQSEVQIAISEADAKVAVAVAEPVVVVTPQQPAPLEMKVLVVASALCLQFVCDVRRSPSVQRGQSCSAFCQSARGLASKSSKVRVFVCACVCVRSFVCYSRVLQRASQSNMQ